MLTSEEWGQFEASGGAMDLSRAVKLRLSGPDALRYLNGQVTNDVRRLAAGESMPACLCNHKGRLEALIVVSRDASGAFYISADEALREFLPLRMEKYLIADDASLEDVTAQFSLIHCFGPSCVNPVSPPLHADSETLRFSATRMGTPGVDLWVRASAREAPVAAAGCDGITSPEAIETLRIDRGIPSWEPELSQGILPPEARLDESAIDYHKGCYTGQEVISRIRSVGQVNKKLQRLIVVGGGTVEPGWQLATEEDDGTTVPAGSITSAAWHPALNAGIALGYVKRGARTRRLLAGPAGGAPVTEVEIRKTLDDQLP